MVETGSKAQVVQYKRPQKQRIQEETSKPVINKKRKMADMTAVEIYKKAARTKEEDTQCILNEEDIQRILAGGPRYKVKDAEVAFYKGLVKNESCNIRVLLAEAGIAP